MARLGREFRGPFESPKNTSGPNGSDGTPPRRGAKGGNEDGPAAPKRAPRKRAPVNKPAGEPAKEPTIAETLAGLEAQGFSDGEAARLLAASDKAASSPEARREQEELNRLKFTRWLVERGLINEFAV